jgi:Holliday junction resolvase RusA-like endonuclease
MERAIISKRIGEIQSELSRLQSALHALELTDVRRFPGNYESLSIDAALRGERIACRLRHLIYSTASVRKADYLNAAADALGIKIERRGGVVEITLPCLLPKKKRRQSTEFLFDALYHALDRYAAAHELPKYRACVVCFSHIYSREEPGRRIRDYDNLEQKHILDIITAFVIADDTGLLCDAYNTTELGGGDRTVISIMDKESFQEWLAGRGKDLKEIVDF